MGDALTAQGLDKVVHTEGGNALYLSLLVAARGFYRRDAAVLVPAESGNDFLSDVRDVQFQATNERRSHGKALRALG